MQQNRGLAYKISLFVLLGTLITVMLMVALNYFHSKALMQKSVLADARNMTFATINNIQTVLVSAEKIPFNLALLLEHSEIPEDKLNDYMQQIVFYNPEVFGCCVAYEPNMFPGKELYAPYYYKKDGKLTYVNLAKDNYEYLYWNWYQIPKMLNKPMWSEPYFDEGGGDIVMSTYSVPFYTEMNGKMVLKGIVTVDISLDWLQKIMSSLYIGKGGYAFLISRKGTFVTHPNVNLIMNTSIFTLAEERNDKHLREIGKRMIHGETGTARFDSRINKQRTWIIYAPLPSNKWSMGVVLPEKILLGDLMEMNRFLILAGIIGIIFLVLIIVVLTRRFIRPLNKLARSVDYIAKDNFDTVLPVVHTDDEIEILSQSFYNMQIALKSYIKNLMETTAAREKLDSEMKIAHDIQMSIVPRTFPPFPDRHELELYALLEPARAVGGDWYDYFFTNEDHLCFAIGDVSGKGVPAAILMAVIRTYLRAKATSLVHVEEIMNAINVEASINNDYLMFATIFIGILNVHSGVLYYCNASHNPPYILRSSGEITKITEMHGVAVGIFEDKTYSSDQIQLYPGDAVVLYTDGITEAMNENEDMFGYAHLERILKPLTMNDAKTIVLNVREEVRNFTGNIEQTDDITIEVIRFQGD
ncbi:MAG TPA: SpoIIE family protein phosphatase [Candidatus Cloacimonadota bacterium]|nr:SpoIIE family protein phosphatase [Candidatus Cloacimonadota bacterium]HPT71360.1 SpoIIE family protein phosphatase [Candidatus Cloacimonadota bacterium]